MATPIDIKIFDEDVTSTAEIEGYPITDVRDSPVKGLIHSTRIPGGFWQLSFNLFLTQAQYTEWRLNRAFYRVKMLDGEGTIFEGRLERVVKDSQGWGATLTWKGYWRNFTDDIDDANHASTTGDAIIKALRDNLHADTDQLSTANTNITATTNTISIDSSAQHKSAWKTITERLSKIESDNSRQIEIAVWEDREVYYREINPSAIDWLASIDNGVISFSPEFDLDDLYNSVDARDSSDPPIPVGFSSDADSVTKYGHQRRTRVGSSQLNTQAATDERDRYLTDHKDGIQQADTLRVNRVTDANGVEKSLCNVRAGQVIRIEDFLTRTEDLGSATPNPFNTFVILETTCNHRPGRGDLTLRVGGEAKDLGSTFARNGIR